MHQTASEPPLDHQVGHLRSQGRHQAAAELLAADAAEWRTLVAVAGCMPQLSSLRTHARANLADLGALRSLTSLIVGAGIALPEAAESGGEVAPAGGPPATAGLPAAQCAPMYPLPPQLEMMLVDDPCRCPSLLLRSSGSSRPPLPAQLLQQHLAPSAFTPCCETFQLQLLETAQTGQQGQGEEGVAAAVQVQGLCGMGRQQQQQQQQEEQQEDGGYPVGSPLPLPRLRCLRIYTDPGSEALLRNVLSSVASELQRRRPNPANLSIVSFE
ncbi:hypothetical protein PLESTM_000833700 [Pleodorina starrii]|nr:hypothetical protein PLESTM_000833700 [Pleodorina starrii]